MRSDHAIAPAKNEATQFPATLGLRGLLPTVEVGPEHLSLFQKWQAAVLAMFKPEDVPPAVAVDKRAWAARNFPAGTRCAYCLAPTGRPERDHIVPFSLGGTETYDNIVPACRSCNARKKDKSLLQFLAEEAPEFHVRPEAVS